MESLKEARLIRLSKSCIGESEKTAVASVLDREYLGMGSEVQIFEELLTNFFGRPAVCVVNGTSALQLALQACGVGRGDEVLVQSLTYVASFQAITATGAVPIACDVLPSTLTIDWRDAERKISNKTKAIMPVHYSGGVGEMNEIYKLAKRNNLRVIEDAAHSFGTTYEGKRIGGFGDISCFSFDGIKNITSGEGGCVVTDNTEVLNLIRDSRLLGVEKDTDKRYSGNRSWQFEVSQQGWRYHMSNIMAAIGIQQLYRFDEFAKIRKKHCRLYDELLEGDDRIIKIRHDYDEVVPHIYVVRIPNLRDREQLQKKLLELGIQTGTHYQPNHQLRHFKNEEILNLNVTDEIYPKILSLPLHVDLTENDIHYVSEKLKELI